MMDTLFSTFLTKLVLANLYLSLLIAEFLSVGVRYLYSQQKVLVKGDFCSAFSIFIFTH
jgi:hypothetical protein